MAGPLVGVVIDPGVSTINAYKRRRRPLGLHGGSDPHLEFEGCVVNLRGYDRQWVIPLTGLATLPFIRL
jgi:hypothetical protein